MAGGGKVHEFFIRAYWLETLADETLQAVTTAEIEAGTRLTNLIAAGGVEEGGNFNRASIALLDEGKIAEYVGTYGRTVNLQFMRTNDADDVARDVFGEKAEGYLVVARDRQNADPEIGDTVTIYELSTFPATPVATAENTFQQIRVETAVQNWSEPEATVSS